VTVKKPYSRSFNCKQCGESFVIHSTEFAQGVIQARDYCSADCRAAAKREKCVRTVVCQECGEAFTGMGPKAKWCSGKCASRHHQKVTNQKRVKQRRDEKYGLRPGQYDAMVAFQENRCAICRKPESQKRAGKIKNLSLDHCHKTGAVRACLCGNCNLLLGNLADNIGMLENFIEYLVFHGMRTSDPRAGIGYIAAVPLLYNPNELT